MRSTNERYVESRYTAQHAGRRHSTNATQENPSPANRANNAALATWRLTVPARSNNHRASGRENGSACSASWRGDVMGVAGCGVVSKGEARPLSLAWPGSVPSPVSHRLQCLLRVDAVVERHHGVVEFLVGFVALARDEHDVSRLGLADDLLDGPAAVEFDGASLGANGAKALLDLRGDFSGIFLARIVAG